MKLADEIQYYAEKFKETREDIYFTKLYNLGYDYYRDTFGAFYKLNYHTTKDILNSTYENVLNYIHTYDPKKGRFSTWFNRIFAHQLFYLNHKYNRLIYFEDVFNPDLSEEEFDFIKKENELHSKLNIALHKVPDLYQTILKEKYYDNMKSKQIASKYNVSEQSIKNALVKGRLILKNILQDPNYEIPTLIHRTNKLKLAIERYNKMMELTKQDLIKIILELEEQIKVLI